MQASIDPVSNYPVPKRVKFSLRDKSYDTEITADFSNYFDRMEILGRLNPVTKKIVGTFFARPFTYRTSHKATATVSTAEGKKKITGDLIAQVIFIK